MSASGDKTFVGLGLTPIQAGLMVREAQRSGHFGRYVIVESNAELVRAVRQAGGCCTVNMTGGSGVDQVTLDGLELYDPADPTDREAIVAAIAASDVMATCLPDVHAYDATDAAVSVARLLAEGLSDSRHQADRPAVVYTTENHPHAAQMLTECLHRHGIATTLINARVVDTVIGRMGSIIEGPEAIGEFGLTPLTPTCETAFLLEQTGRVLVSRLDLPGVHHGLDCFIETDNLPPFAEARLYAQAAVHAIIGYLADLRVYETIAKAGDDEELMTVARAALIDESGAALIARYGDSGDALFTPGGWRDYADDLLDRMVNVHLYELTARVCHDPVGKLGYDGRLYGTMRMCLTHGIQPVNVALGTAGCLLSMILRGDEIPDLPETVPADPSVLTPVGLFQILRSIWGDIEDEHTEALIDLTWDALERLKTW